MVRRTPIITLRMDEVQEELRQQKAVNTPSSSRAAGGQCSSWLSVLQPGYEGRVRKPRPGADVRLENHAFKLRCSPARRLLACSTGSHGQVLLHHSIRRRLPGWCSAHTGEQPPCSHCKVVFAAHCSHQLSAAFLTSTCLLAHCPACRPHPPWQLPRPRVCFSYTLEQYPTQCPHTAAVGRTPSQAQLRMWCCCPC